MQEKLKRRWWLKGSLGTLFLGAGLSGAIESGFLKASVDENILWILAGTASLGLVISGVVFLIEAGIANYELGKMKTDDD